MPEAQTTQDATIIQSDSQQSLLDNTNAMEFLSDTIRDLSTSLAKIAHMLTQQYEQDDFYEPIRLYQSVEWTLDKHGRRFALIFAPVALASITINAQGVTGTVTIPAGWSCLNEPDRTVFTPPAGMSQLVLVKYSNWWSGSAA